MSNIGVYEQGGAVVVVVAAAEVATAVIMRLVMSKSGDCYDKSGCCYDQCIGKVKKLIFECS